MIFKTRPPRAAITLSFAVGVLLLTGCRDDDPVVPPLDPPVVSTGSVLTVGQRSAVVGGRVDPRSAETTYWFEFGPDPSYGGMTERVSLPPNPGGSQSVSSRLEGLSPATLYHFRLVAGSAGGTARGEDQSLVTLDANQPPNTAITAAGTDTLGTIVRWHLFWSGMDTDGVVTRYELRVADHGADGALDPPDTLGVPWAATLVTDTLLTWEDGLGSRTAFVRAVDDREARDPTPASISAWAPGDPLSPR